MYKIPIQETVEIPNVYKRGLDIKYKTELLQKVACFQKSNHLEVK